MFSNTENKWKKRWKEKREKWEKLPFKEKYVYPSILIAIVFFVNYTLTGGFGFDSFNFTALNESTINNSDLITDFTVGQDSINFSNLGFTAIQAGEGSGTVLGYSYDQGTDITTIEDANSDFAIQLSRKVDLTNDDFSF